MQGQRRGGRGRFGAGWLQPLKKNDFLVGMSFGESSFNRQPEKSAGRGEKEKLLQPLVGTDGETN